MINLAACSYMKLSSLLQKKLFLLPALALLLNGCAHYYYIPNTQNVPLFKEKNEARILAALSGGGHVSATEAQLAWSFTKNLALMANFLTAKGETDSENSWAKGNSLEGAIGFFKPINDLLIVEIYGGYGLGKQHHQYEKYNNSTLLYNKAGVSDLSFSKIFLQPSAGLSFKGFDIALSGRINYLSFSKINNNIDPTISEFDELDLIASNKSYLFLEPCLTIRGGWKFIKVQMQFINSRNFTNNSLRFEDSSFSLGLYISLGKRFSIK
jgi:hypothetical protein